MRKQARAMQIVRPHGQQFRGRSREAPCLIDTGPIDTGKNGAGNAKLDKKVKHVTLASHRTGVILIEFARQSCTPWHAVGSSCFERQTETPVR